MLQPSTSVVMTPMAKSIYWIKICQQESMQLYTYTPAKYTLFEGNCILLSAFKKLKAAAV